MTFSQDCMLTHPSPIGSKYFIVVCCEYWQCSIDPIAISIYTKMTLSMSAVGHFLYWLLACFSTHDLDICLLENKRKKGWRGGSGIKSTCCLPEDSDSITGIHIVAHNYSSSGIQCPLLASRGTKHTCRHKCSQNIHAHKI